MRNVTKATITTTLRMLHAERLSISSVGPRVGIQFPFLLTSKRRFFNLPFDSD